MAGWSRMFISGSMYYLSIKCPTNEEMDSYHKVTLNPFEELKLSDLDDNGQWDDSNNDAIFGANISATSSTWSDDVLESLLSAPEYKAPNVTFSDDVAFTKGATDDELLFDIMELDTR